MLSPRASQLVFIVFAALVAASTSFSILVSSNKYKLLSSRLYVGGGETWDGDSGSIEQIEFKIYPDGRVEETVRGIKGNNCHKVTEKINENLGKVVASEPTEEMYEQEVVQDQTIKQTESGWEGSSSW